MNHENHASRPPLERIVSQTGWNATLKTQKGDNQMTKNQQHLYEQGPTTCAPTPEVVRCIQQEIKASRALSRGDIRLATAMGLVNSDAIRPLGFNDGVFYPLAESVARSAPGAVKPLEMVSLAPQPQQRTMHALALLVDFSDNPGTRPKAEFETLLFDSNNPNSMASYYSELSGGALQVTGKVVGYLRAPQPYGYYTAGQSGTGINFPNNPIIRRDCWWMP
jgi:immune inhibitor A